MAEDETGWSEKGKNSGRDKRLPGADPAEAGVAATSASESATVPSRPSKRDSGAGKDKAASTVVRTPSNAGARKVAKAAATAGQRDVSFATRLGFPALVALVCLLGIGVVFYAWTQREALARPAQGDHWHAVYGVYDCTLPGDSRYLPPFLSSNDSTGIHSHGDGVMHIHPFFEASAGDRARFNHWFDEMGIDVTPEQITLDNGTVLTAGTECADGSGPAEIRVLEWQFDFQANLPLDERSDPENVYFDNFRDINFDNDRQVFIIAFAAAGTDDLIPSPPEDRFNTLNNVSSALEYDPTELTPLDSGATTDDSAPADTSTDEPVDE